MDWFLYDRDFRHERVHLWLEGSRVFELAEMVEILKNNVLDDIKQTSAISNKESYQLSWALNNFNN